MHKENLELVTIRYTEEPQLMKYFDETVARITELVSKMPTNENNHFRTERYITQSFLHEYSDELMLREFCGFNGGVA